MGYFRDRFDGDSFGAECPLNWKEICDYLNGLLDEMEEPTHEDMEDIWERWCTGRIPGAPSGVYEDELVAGRYLMLTKYEDAIKEAIEEARSLVEARHEPFTVYLWDDGYTSIWRGVGTEVESGMGIEYRVVTTIYPDREERSWEQLLAEAVIADNPRDITKVKFRTLVEQIANAFSASKCNAYEFYNGECVYYLHIRLSSDGLYYIVGNERDSNLTFTQVRSGWDFPVDPETGVMDYGESLDNQSYREVCEGLAGQVLDWVSCEYDPDEDYD